MSRHSGGAGAAPGNPTTGGGYHRIGESTEVALRVLVEKVRGGQHPTVVDSKA